MGDFANTDNTKINDVDAGDRDDEWMNTITVKKKKIILSRIEFSFKCVTVICIN